MTDQIRAILAQHARLRTPAGELRDDTDLYQAGLTSHASVTLMLALEDAFEIEFPERLLRRDTFSSIANIHAAVASLRVALPGAAG